MRVLIAEPSTFLASRWADRFHESGATIVGPARSSGEAFLLACQQEPTLAIVNVDLESHGAGRRLAVRLQDQMNIACVLVLQDESPDPLVLLREHAQRSDETADRTSAAQEQVNEKSLPER